MRYDPNRRRSSPTMEFNATPMVDVIFLLTIFFMLVTRFSSAEQVPMELPKPDESQAKLTKSPVRVVINCRLADPADPDIGDVRYSVGPNQPESLQVIGERLAAMHRDTPNLTVIVRADRRLTYADVRPVMNVIARLRIRMLNVAAHVAEAE